MTNRELDALIAEKVFGWTHCAPNSPYDGEVTGVFFGTGRPHGGGTIPLPHYSTDISAAWEVVEKVGLLNEYLLGCWDDGIWVVSDVDGNWYADAVTAPLAICLAALKAKGGM